MANVGLAFLAILTTIVFPAAYNYLASSFLPSRCPMPRGRRIGLLIAHPDDEAMFFSPTVLALTRPSAGNTLRILCLSVGNAEGLGETRKKELVKSAQVLGVRDENDVTVVDSPDFPDSMTTVWPRKKIVSLLYQTFGTSTPQGGSLPDIDILVTFDAGGVSSHPNHKSLYYGAREFVSQVSAVKPGSASPSSAPASADTLDTLDTPVTPITPITPVALYTLTSISWARKYSGPFDVIVTLLKAAWWGFLARRSDAGGALLPEGMIFASSLISSGEGKSSESPPSVTKGWEAMTRAHVSQMVWFRWGWIVGSRYMYVNDLKRETVG